MEEIYVVKVRTEPDPSRLYPSERRYSALTVGGLGAVHLLLAATSLLLGCLGLALQSDSCWTGRYGGGLWLGIAAAAAGAAGILAWRRWYVDNNIRWFFISSTVAATTSLLCLVITAAALAAIQEQKSTQELYRSIYYDQGIIQDIGELPSLSLQESEHQNVHFRQDDQLLHGDNIVANSEDVNSDQMKESEDSQINSQPDRDGNKHLEDVSIDDIDYEGNTEVSKISNNNDDTNGTDESSKGEETTDESPYIMKITKGNRSTNKTIDPALLSVLKGERLDPAENKEDKDLYVRPKKSTQNYQMEGNLEGNIEYRSRVIDEENKNESHLEEVTPEEAFSSNDESQDIVNVPVNIHNNDMHMPNHTVTKFTAPKHRFKQDQPHFEKVPRSSREVRTVVAINILVASALELAWSLLSASIAWKGMKNNYPYESSNGSCERTVEGLERSPPPPPPSSIGTFATNKMHSKLDSGYRKPDIISNHKHCHSGNNIRVQNKNGINRLVINTVSERINTEPYLPMEESTMEYQERVHRFLNSNNVANNNASDSASNLGS